MNIIIRIIRFIFGVRSECNDRKGVREFRRYRWDSNKDDKHKPNKIDDPYRVNEADLDELFDEVERLAGKPCSEMTIKEIMGHLTKVNFDKNK